MDKKKKKTRLELCEGLLVVGLDFRETHIERQNLHRRVEEFVSWVFDVPAAEEIPERCRHRHKQSVKNLV